MQLLVLHLLIYHFQAPVKAKKASITGAADVEVRKHSNAEALAFNY
jgi:hypothetical protein